MLPSTIAAIATPMGTGGIGIIKISGTHSLGIAEALFHSSTTLGAGKKNHHFESHRLYYGLIVDPESNETVDEVLISFMQAPWSYTREDIVEIQAHSGIATLSRILSLVLKNGAQLAEPGEFTKRAFLNGRINLTQAEGVIDIIESKSRKALRMAMAQMNGNMHRQIQTARRHLINYLAQIETAIDFIEDPDDTIIDDTLPQRIKKSVVDGLVEMEKQYQRAHLYREGIKLAVVGKPNVGKSSLLNCLIKKDRAIVTEIPGTTRDIIEESVTIKGIPVLIVDTAGLREGGGTVEKIGIQKTRECIGDADLVVFMVDATAAPDEDDRRIFKQVKHKNILIVRNKMDLLSRDKKIRLPEDWDGYPVVIISVTRQAGIEKLEESIRHAVLQGDGVLGENPLVPNLRQKQLIEQALSATLRLIGSLEEGNPLEIAAIDAKEAIEALGQIIGESIDEAVIDRIFSRFCIGK
jgi:tRNA modification GTPase